MIHYTVNGPKFKLLVHDDKISLERRVWSKLFTFKKREGAWDLEGLQKFNITDTYLFWGKLEWESFDGVKGSFWFSTNHEIVSKIEKYMHKKILKNHSKIKVMEEIKKELAAAIAVPVQKKMSKKKARKKQQEALAA